LYISDRQVNFLVPAGVPVGSADVVVSTSVASSAPVRVAIEPAAPGIFFDPATGHGAILNPGTAFPTFLRPARAGQAIEVYCTGLGAVRDARPGIRETIMNPEVTIGGIRAAVLYSGLAPGYQGLYQVNVQVPPEMSAGVHNLSIGVNGQTSNAVRIAVQ
jgi:uncharacterized protein (TIGR03437 family)